MSMVPRTDTEARERNLACWWFQGKDKMGPSREKVPLEKKRQVACPEMTSSKVRKTEREPSKEMEEPQASGGKQPHRVSASEGT